MNLQTQAEHCFSLKWDNWFKECGHIYILYFSCWAFPEGLVAETAHSPCLEGLEELILTSNVHLKKVREKSHEALESSRELLYIPFIIFYK